MKIVNIFLIICFCFCMVSCDYINQDFIIDSYYEDYDAAKKPGAIAPQEPIADMWIPSLLPESAYNIYERHDLDSSLQWLRFSFNNADLHYILKFCDPVENEKVIFPRSKNIDWWPEDISKSNENYSYYRCYKNVGWADFWLMVDSDTNTAYFWSTKS